VTWYTVLYVKSFVHLSASAAPFLSLNETDIVIVIYSNGDLGIVQYNTVPSEFSLF
jgi:hypothetical protein